MKINFGYFLSFGIVPYIVHLRVEIVLCSVTELELLDVVPDSCLEIISAIFSLVHEHLSLHQQC